MSSAAHSPSLVSFKQDTTTRSAPTRRIRPRRRGNRLGLGQYRLAQRCIARPWCRVSVSHACSSRSNWRCTCGRDRHRDRGRGSGVACFSGYRQSYLLKAGSIVVASQRRPSDSVENAAASASHLGGSWRKTEARVISCIFVFFS